LDEMVVFAFFLPKFNINNWLEVKNSISW
jgi:hypothetical protein